MGLLGNLALKVLVSKKEQFIAMALKVLSDQYEEHKDDLAAKIVAAIPEKHRRHVHPDEMIHLLDVLQECCAKLAAAIKPLFSD